MEFVMLKGTDEDEERTAGESDDVEMFKKLETRRAKLATQTGVFDSIVGSS
jgi:hypothetical protein